MPVNIFETMAFIVRDTCRCTYAVHISCFPSPVSCSRLIVPIRWSLGSKDCLAGFFGVP